MNLIGLFLGRTIGALAGYLGWVVDAVAMRGLDVLTRSPLWCWRRRSPTACYWPMQGNGLGPAGRFSAWGQGSS